MARTLLARSLAASALALALGCAGVDGPPRCPSDARLAGAAPPDGSEAWCETAEGLPHGPQRGWHADGSLAYEGAAVEGATHGPWRQFYRSGARKSEARFERGLIVGRFRTWHANGRLEFDGVYDERGLEEGVWRRWWPNGELRLEWGMAGGRHHGPVRAYHPNGRLRMQGRRAHGLREGTWLHWDAEGRPESRVEYEADREVAREELASDAS